MIHSLRRLSRPRYARYALIALFTGASAVATAAPDVDDSPVDVTIAGYSSGGQVSVFGEGVIDAVRRTYDNSSIVYEPGNPAGVTPPVITTSRRPSRIRSLEAPVGKATSFPPHFSMSLICLS